MRAGVLLVVLSAAATTAAVRWTSTFGLSCRYCDNLFQLSPGDLESFRRSESPDRFPYRTSDDLDVTLTGALAGSFSRAGRIELGVRGHQYVSNWEKSYAAARAGAEYELGPVGRFRLGLAWMPDYLIRHYRRLDPAGGGEYAACRFSEYVASAELRRSFGALQVVPSCACGYDDYLREFEQYDSRILRLGAKLRWDPVANLDLVADYEYRSAQAAGPVPDISYRQHGLVLRAGSRPPSLTRFRLAAEYRRTWRSYTTANRPEVDPAHAGRDDEIEAIGVELRYGLGRASLKAEYEFEWREVTSPYSATIEEVKDYRCNVYGIGLVVEPGKGGRR